MRDIDCDTRLAAGEIIGRHHIPSKGESGSTTQLHHVMLGMSRHSGSQAPPGNLLPRGSASLWRWMVSNGSSAEILRGGASGHCGPRQSLGPRAPALRRRLAPCRSRSQVSQKLLRVERVLDSNTNTTIPTHSKKHRSQERAGGNDKQVDFFCLLVFGNGVRGPTQGNGSQTENPISHGRDSISLTRDALHIQYFQENS